MTNLQFYDLGFLKGFLKGLAGLFPDISVVGFLKGFAEPCVWRKHWSSAIGLVVEGEGLEEALAAGAEGWGEGLGPASGLGRVTGGAREEKKRKKKKGKEN